MPPTRRATIAVLAFLAAAGPALADDSFVHGGYSVDLSGAPARTRPALAAYLRQQIDQVNGLAMSEDIKAWFRTIPIDIDPSIKSPGRYGKGRLTLKGETGPPENPVLLHELLHAFHDQKLPQGMRNPQVIAYFRRAKSLGRWPERAYMLSAPNEFFAMTASVLLWGRAARPPETRAELTEAMPRYAAWLTELFGYTGP